MKTILILNGSPKGSKGNCQKLISQIENGCPSKSEIDTVHLSQRPSNLRQRIRKASALVFVTGTYWDSWGSPLQKFLEDFTDLEGSADIVGKPCAVFVLMHSVGGKGVLSRLQGVLSTFGFLIPPMSGMVYSYVADRALRSQNDKRGSSQARNVGALEDDLWSLQDIRRILGNLWLSSNIQINWEVWPVDSNHFSSLWLEPPPERLRPPRRKTGKP